MKIIKADNYQTWYLENNNNAILIDPWLTNTLQPEGSFFIQRRKNNSTCLSKVEIDKVNGIIITAPFEDHLHMESINMLSELSVSIDFANPKAAVTPIRGAPLTHISFIATQKSSIFLSSTILNSCGNHL